MAGISEACSHIGALLYSIRYEASKRDSLTCTQEKNQWLGPAYVKDIPYVPVSEMVFQSAKKKHQQLLEHNIQHTAVRNTPIQQQESDATEDEQLDFFRNIAQSSTKPAVLSLVAPFNNIYVPGETLSSAIRSL